MAPILTYLLKLSISLAVVYMFYHFVLRRLTFYNWNRWYLVSYSLLSFFIPFIDISFVVNNNEIERSTLLQWVPALNDSTLVEAGTPVDQPGVTGVFIIKFILLAGIMFMLARLAIQLLSFRKMLRKASLIPSDGMRLYQVDEPIMPFSFGNSIFINRSLHNENDLGEIILHEFVHVKQKHSVDIIFSELMCLVNWYNPFAWLIRKAMRQNLEFIADNQVLENGIDRKQYQYLLLKVIGNNHFSIAPKFNFSSLKKRIAMMNKMKSAGVHVVKFLFILPLVAVLLLAFRNQYQEKMKDLKSDSFHLRPVTDTVPSLKTPNDKGYFIDIKGINGECMVVVKNKDGKEVQRVLLNEWKEDSKYEELYGEILTPPTPPAVPVPPTEPVNPAEPTMPTPPALPTPCCSECPDMVAPVAVTAVGGHVNGLRGVASSYEITDKLATIELKDGTVEKYDITNPEEKARFESKYGKLMASSSGIGVNNVALLEARRGEGVYNVAPVARGMNGLIVVDDFGYEITGKEDILVKITKNTTRQELDQFKTKMKEKGIELIFDVIDYDGNGKLVTISGRMKLKDGQNNFTANDFEVLMLAMIKKDDQSILKVSIKDQKDVI